MLLCYFAAFLLVTKSLYFATCKELEIIGKNSMVYDPVTNLPYPCEITASKKEFTARTKIKGLKGFMRSKRADGDSIPIKLQPCPSPSSTQEHRWLKTMKKSGVSLLATLNNRSKQRKLSRKRNDVIQKIHEKDALMRAQLHAETDVITGHGVGLSGASLGVLNMLPYVHAFDTKTGMPYVCDPYKKAPDDKFDNRWKMVVPPCPDFKKCLFPWNEAKDCKTSVDDISPESHKRRWIMKRVVWLPVMAST